jgi:hypothetical protein
MSYDQNMRKQHLELQMAKRVTFYWKLSQDIVEAITGWVFLFVCLFVCLFLNTDAIKWNLWLLGVKQEQQAG